MASNSLYRKFRPRDFESVIGQDHVIKPLKNQVKSGEISHAYIFTGTRGTGKTTTARIFARAINCEHPVDGSPCEKCNSCLNSLDAIDVIELDAASNNGVSEIRALRDNAVYTTLTTKYKVYIIDEVHMLSPSAANALLKTLEEPPEHLVFILATTEIHKVLPTVLSRCMRFDFRLVPIELIENMLSGIFDKLKVKYEKSAVRALAKLGEGSVRDSLSYADVALSYADRNLTMQSVTECLFVNSPESYMLLIKAILERDLEEAMKQLDKILEKGSNVNIVRREICEFLRNLIFIKISTYNENKDIEKTIFDKMKEVFESFEKEPIYRVLELFIKLENDIRYTTNPKTMIEAAVIKATSVSNDLEPLAFASRMSSLEKDIEKLKNTRYTIEKVQTTNEISQIEIKKNDDVVEPKDNQNNSDKKKKSKTPSVIKYNLIKKAIEKEYPILEYTMNECKHVTCLNNKLTMYFNDKTNVNTMNDYKDELEKMLKELYPEENYKLYPELIKTDVQGSTYKERQEEEDKVDLLFGRFKIVKS